MAKRKRSELHTSTTARKKQKGYQHPHGADVDQNKEYKADSILAERGDQYLISWEDDEDTGETYEPTWEPKQNANRALVDSWRHQKANRQQKAKRQAAKREAAGTGFASSSPVPAKRKRGRPRKVIDSSPPPEDEPLPPTDTPGQEPAGTVRQSVLEINESQESNAGLAATSRRLSTPNADSPLFVPADTPNSVSDSGKAVVAVEVSDPPSSYINGAYAVLTSSQLKQSSSAAQTRTSPEPSQYVPNPLDNTETTEGTTTVTLAPSTQSEQPLSASANVGETSVVVTDSQGLHPSSSYVPTTSTSKASNSKTSGKDRDRIPASSALQARTQATASTQGVKPAEERQAQELSQSISSGVQYGSREKIAGASQGSAAGVRTEHSPVARPTGEDGLQPKAASAPTSTHISISDRQIIASVDSAQRTVNSPDSFNQPGQPESHTHGQDDSDVPYESIEFEDRGEEPLSVRSQSDFALISAHRGSGQNHVDLCSTTAEQSNGAANFAITPPQRSPRYPPEREARPQPDSSAYFPFKTQLSLDLSNGPQQARSSGEIQAPQTQPLPQELTQLSQLSTITPRASSVPQIFSHPLPTLSQLPHPPSSGGRATFTPRDKYSTPSPSPDNTMDGTPSTRMSLRERIEKLKRDREASKDHSTSPQISTTAAKGNAGDKAVDGNLALKPAALNVARLASPALLNDRAPRSPSAVPAQAPLPVITQEEMNTSERYETLLPQAHDTETSERARNGSIVAAGTPRAKEPHEDPEKANVYTIPISLFGHQRDQYPQMIYYYRNLIERFLSTSAPEEKLLQETKHFVQRMRDIAMHPDLDNTETLTQQGVTPSRQAEWDVKCSAKFSFLGDLVERLRNEKLHVAVVSSPGRVVGMLETFLVGIGITLYQSGSSNGAEGTRVLKITVLSTEDELTDGESADLVVALDSFVKPDLQAVRALRQNSNTWAPFITLVVPYTVEHVERSLSPALSEQASLRALVNGIHHLRKDGGKLEDGQLAVKDAAAALAGYLIARDPDAAWPLAPLGMLEDFDSQTESEIEPLENGVPGTAHAGIKRTREEEDDTGEDAEIGKKARIDQPSSSNVEVTHISDSINASGLVNALGESAEVFPPASTPIEQRLQERLIANQNELAELTKTLSDLQYRFEEQSRRLNEVSRALAQANARAENAVTRMSEYAGSRGKIKDLEEQLKQANERLINRSVPERRELEALRLAAIEANARAEKFNKQLETSNKDLAYTRELYQNASNIAQQRTAENAELKNELAVTQNRATGEQVKLRQMTYDAHTKELERENKKLKAMVKDQAAGIKFRDEEIAKLKDASRGRMSTRGTSVPRSPRLGSPMKMGSRQGSPAAGELRGRRELLHPLRNA